MSDDVDAFWAERMNIQEALGVQEVKETRAKQIRRWRSSTVAGALSQTIEDWLTSEARHHRLGEMTFAELAEHLAAYIAMSEAAYVDRRYDRAERKVAELQRDKAKLQRQLNKVAAGVRALADELHPSGARMMAHHPYAQIAAHLRSLVPEE